MLALVLVAGCAATDEPYIPSSPSTISETGTAIVPPGPANPEVFRAIETAESAVGGEAVAFETRIKAYTVTVIAAGELHEVTLVGSGMIVNTVRDVDDGIQSFLESQVVTLADAIDAAAVARPGRVDSAAIALEDSGPVYDVVIEVEGELVTLSIDAFTAEILQR